MDERCCNDQRLDQLLGVAQHADDIMQVIVPEAAAPGSFRLPVSAATGSVTVPVIIAAMQFGSAGASESELPEALATPAPATSRTPTAAPPTTIRMHLLTEPSISSLNDWQIHAVEACNSTSSVNIAACSITI